MAGKVIEATLEIVRPNGDQGFRVGPGQNDLIWLVGPDRAEDVSVGDKGVLVQETNGTKIWYEFEAA